MCSEGIQRNGPSQEGAENTVVAQLKRTIRVKLQPKPEPKNNPESDMFKSSTQRSCKAWITKPNSDNFSLPVSEQKICTTESREMQILSKQPRIENNNSPFWITPPSHGRGLEVGNPSRATWIKSVTVTTARKINQKEPRSRRNRTIPRTQEREL